MTYEPVQSAKPAQSAIFAAKMLPNLQPAGHGLIVWDQPSNSPALHSIPRQTLAIDTHI
jgi:hypothetical protein